MSTSEIVIGPERAKTSNTAGGESYKFGGWVILSLCIWAPVAFLVLIGLLRAQNVRTGNWLDLMRERMRFVGEAAKQLSVYERKFSIVWNYFRCKIEAENSTDWKKKAWDGMVRAGLGPVYLRVAPFPQSGQASETLGPDDLIHLLAFSKNAEMARKNGMVVLSASKSIPLSLFEALRRENTFFRLPNPGTPVWCGWGRLREKLKNLYYIVIIDMKSMVPKAIDASWLRIIKSEFTVFQGEDQISRHEFNPRPNSWFEIPGGGESEDVFRWHGFAGLRCYVHDSCGFLAVTRWLPARVGAWGVAAWIAWLFLNFSWLLGSYRYFVRGEIFWVGSVTRRVALHLLPAAGLPLLGVLLIGEMEVAERVSGKLAEDYGRLSQETEQIEGGFLLAYSEEGRKLGKELAKCPGFGTASDAVQWALGKMELGFGISKVQLVSSEGADLLPNHYSLSSAYLKVAGLSPARRSPFMRRFFEGGANLNAYYLKQMSGPYSSSDPRYAAWLKPSLDLSGRILGSEEGDLIVRKGLSAMGRQVCRKFNRKAGLLSPDNGPEKLDISAFATSFGGMASEDLVGFLSQSLGKIIRFNTQMEPVLEMLDLIKDRSGRANYFVMFHWKESDFFFPIFLNFIREWSRRKNQFEAFFLGIGGRESPDVSTTRLPLGIKTLARSLVVPGQTRRIMAIFPDGQWRLVFMRRSTEFGYQVFGCAQPVFRLVLYEQQLRNRLGLLFAGLLALLVFFTVVLRRFLVVPIRDLMLFAECLGRPSMAPVEVRNAIGEWGKLALVFSGVKEDLKELDVAGAVQSSLLPRGVFERGSLRIHGRSVMMEQVGGDYFDFVADPADQNTVYICLGDVSGHGLAAALVMVMVGIGIRILLEFGVREPAAILEELNRHFLAFLRRVRMMTCEILRIDCRTGRFTLANAGQTPVMNVHPSGLCESIFAVGFPLATAKKTRIGVVEGFVEPGGYLVFCTDGAIEARDKNGQVIGYPRVEKEVASRVKKGFDGSVDRMFEFVTDATGGQNWDDDVTFVVAYYSPVSGQTIDDAKD